ncbi:hypothetical protein T261_8376 [Streptomyces lydicus]|nr:hypothetical protein T261_8376 [Streptomyces lydicus]
MGVRAAAGLDGGDLVQRTAALPRLVIVAASGIRTGSVAGSVRFDAGGEVGIRQRKFDIVRKPHGAAR